MLTLTDNARIAISEILASTQEPETAGLRIARSANKPGALDLSISTLPADGDAVIEQTGARVFVDERVSEALSSRVLDVAAGAAGEIEFRIADAA